jgi:hypothetical protein
VITLRGRVAVQLRWREGKGRMKTRKGGIRTGSGRDVPLHTAQLGVSFLCEPELAAYHGFKRRIEVRYSHVRSRHDVVSTALSDPLLDTPLYENTYVYACPRGRAVHGCIARSGYQRSLLPRRTLVAPVSDNKQAARISVTFLSLGTVGHRVVDGKG